MEAIANGNPVIDLAGNNLVPVGREDFLPRLERLPA